MPKISADQARSYRFLTIMLRRNIDIGRRGASPAPHIVPYFNIHACAALLGDAENVLSPYSVCSFCASRN
jgi:hypothetical protein